MIAEALQTLLKEKECCVIIIFMDMSDADVEMNLVHSTINEHHGAITGTDEKKIWEESTRKAKSKQKCTFDLLPFHVIEAASTVILRKSGSVEAL